MSYRRAWLLVDEINQIFVSPWWKSKWEGPEGRRPPDKARTRHRRPLPRHRGAAATASAADLRALKASLPSRPASPRC